MIRRLTLLALLGLTACSPELADSADGGGRPSTSDDDGDGNAVDGDAEGGAGGQTQSLACESDEDCDDNIFCNGEESCESDGKCASGTRPACEDDVACTLDFCDEAAQECKLWADHSACKGSLVCDTTVGCTMPALPIDSTGLVGRWTFENDDATDYSGNGNHGVPSSGVAFVDIDGRRAARFAPEYVAQITVPSSESLRVAGPDMTIEVWHYSAWMSADGFFDLVNKPNSYRVRVPKWGPMQASFTNATVTATVEAQQSLITYVWEHYAFVRKGSSVVVYINGVQTSAGTLSSGGSIRLTDDALLLGARGGALLDSYDTVYIDEIRIWSRALTNEEAWDTGLGAP